MCEGGVRGRRHGRSAALADSTVAVRANPHGHWSSCRNYLVIFNFPLGVLTTYAALKVAVSPLASRPKQPPDTLLSLRTCPLPERGAIVSLPVELL